MLQRHPSSRIARCLILVLLLLCGARAGGSPQEIVLPSIEELTARIGALAEGDEEGRGELRTILQETLDDLRAAAEWRQKTAEFEREAAAAPALLVALGSNRSTPGEPVLPTDLESRTLAQMEQASNEVAARLAAAIEEEAKLRDEPARRLARREQLAGESARLDSALAALKLEIEGLQATPERTARDQALLERKLAQSSRLSAELACHRAELSSYDARADLLPARRDAAARNVTRLRAENEAWLEAVAARSKDEAEDQRRKVLAVTERVVAAHPQLADLAAECVSLAEERTRTTALKKQAVDRKVVLTAQVVDLLDRASRMRARALSGGQSEAMGLLLRREFDHIQNIDDPAAEAAEWRAAQARIAYRALEFDEQREAVTEQLHDVAGWVATLPEVAEGADPALQEAARELIGTKAALLDGLIPETNTYVSRLSEVEAACVRLHQVEREYREFIEERILWVRSVQGGWLPKPRVALDAVLWATNPSAWRAAGVHALKTLGKDPLPAIPLGLLAVLVLSIYPVVRRRLLSYAPLVVKHRTDRFSHTIIAAVYTIAMGSGVPLALWWIGDRMIHSDDPVDVGVAAGHGLHRAAAVWFSLMLVANVARPQGLGPAHFRWPERSTALMRRLVRTFLPIAIVLAPLVAFFANSGRHPYDDVLGRAAFILSMFALMSFLWLLLRRKSGLLDFYFQRNPGSLIERTRPLWFSAAVAAPVVLAGFAAAGYYYTATQIQEIVRLTLLFVLLLVLVNALVRRWLFVAPRHLAVAQARVRTAARAEAQGQDGQEATVATFDEEAVDIPAIDSQTKAIFRAGISTAFVLGLYLIWSGVLPALRVLDRVQLWPTMRIVSVAEQAASGDRHSSPLTFLDGPSTNGDAGSARSEFVLPGVPRASSPPNESATETSEPASQTQKSAHVVTLANVLAFLLILFFVTVAARNLPGLLEITILKRLPFDAGARNAASTIARYLIVIVGSTVAFSMIGIGWAQMQWLAAALTFGLAFGLQGIFANFVSGLIILLERPVRIGDVVTVGGIEGKVTRTRMRATTITDWDNRELLVPNKEFITGQVINWTLSDSITRLIFTIGIAYGSDTDAAERTLLDVAARCPKACKQPRPSVVFRGFGDSTLQFDLRIYIPNRDSWAEVTHWINMSIDRAFRAARIEIAFPQRDLHIRTIGPLADALARDAEKARPVERVKEPNG